MRGVVQRAWDVSKKREQIFQLAERGRQLGLMLQINDGLEWLPMLVYVGNELELWANWPQLHDAPEIVPTADSDGNDAHCRERVRQPGLADSRYQSRSIFILEHFYAEADRDDFSSRLGEKLLVPTVGESTVLEKSMNLGLCFS
jgi:hypothetical protein